MRSVILFAVGMLTFPTAVRCAVAEPLTMDVVDFLVDGKSLTGKFVTVTGCQLVAANSFAIQCSAGSAGNFPIDSASLAREDLRKALRQCTDWTTGTNCRASATGFVQPGPLGDPSLKNAKIVWTPEAQ